MARFMHAGAAATLRRFFIGLVAVQFTSAGTKPAASETVMIPTATSCFGVGCTSASNVYKCIHNDSTGNPVYEDILTTAGATITIDNTTGRKLWLNLDNAYATGYISIDDHIPLEVTANLPTEDAALYFCAFVENNTGATKGLHLGKVKLITSG